LSLYMYTYRVNLSNRVIRQMLECFPQHSGVAGPGRQVAGGAQAAPGYGPDTTERYALYGISRKAWYEGVDAISPAAHRASKRDPVGPACRSTTRLTMR
jgi:hypothetical protein